MYHAHFYYHLSLGISGGLSFLIYLPLMASELTLRLLFDGLNITVNRTQLKAF